MQNLSKKTPTSLSRSDSQDNQKISNNIFASNVFLSWILILFYYIF